MTEEKYDPKVIRYDPRVMVDVVRKFYHAATGNAMDSEMVKRVRFGFEGIAELYQHYPDQTYQVLQSMEPAVKSVIGKTLGLKTQDVGVVYGSLVDLLKPTEEGE